MKLIKSVVILLLVVGLVVGIAIPVLANNGNAAAQTEQANKGNGNKEKSNNGKTQVVKGEIASINNNVITVGDKEVTVTDETRYKMPGRKDATIADIETGMRIVAQTRPDSNGKLVARQIEVVPQPNKEVKNSSHTGNVTAFAYVPATGGNITIQEKPGTLVTFEILAGDFKILPDGTTVKIGDWVTVTSHRDPAQNRLIATGVVVHPPKPQPSPKYVEGIITQISANVTDNSTITIDTTVFRINTETVFVLHGVLAVQTGQEAIVYSRASDNNTPLATRVVINLPGTLEAEEADEDIDED